MTDEFAERVENTAAATVSKSQIRVAVASAVIAAISAIAAAAIPLVVQSQREDYSDLATVQEDIKKILETGVTEETLTRSLDAVEGRLTKRLDGLDREVKDANRRLFTLEGRLDPKGLSSFGGADVGGSDLVVHVPRPIGNDDL